MHGVAAWLKRRAENVSVALLSVLFATFIFQIASRYVLDAPLSWTVEVSLTAWLWLVFWDTAFCLADRDHVKFDVLYLACRERVRRVLAIVAALAIAGSLLVTLPATWSFLSFYQIKRSATLEVPLDYIFSVYAVFALATIIRYGLRVIAILRGAPPDHTGGEHDELVEGELVRLP